MLEFLIGVLVVAAIFVVWYEVDESLKPFIKEKVNDRRVSRKSKKH